MPTEIRPFHAMTIGKAAHRLEEAGRRVFHMEFGQPTARPPGAVLRAAEAMLDDGVKGYWESAALKDEIAASYASLYGVGIDPSRIILTCGASPALALALMAGFAPGDRIAMARPGYVAHRNCVIGLHMRPVELPCDATTGFRLTASMVDAVDPAPAGLIVASPANPTGSVIPRAQLEAIVEVCMRKGIRIISDEIYNLISYEGAAASLCELTDTAAVVNSFSKFYAMPGWRLGWAVMPEELAPRAHAYMSNFFLTPPSLSQAAGLAALRATEELHRHVEVYRRNRARLLAALPELGLREIAPPDGAFYIYTRVDHLTDDSRSLCLGLLEDTGVATASGIDFDPEEGHRFMRFSFAVSEAELAEALERITPWFAARRAQTGG